MEVLGKNTKNYDQNVNRAQNVPFTNFWVFQFSFLILNPNIKNKWNNNNFVNNDDKEINKKY